MEVLARRIPEGTSTLLAGVDEAFKHTSRSRTRAREWLKLISATEILTV
jgi:hypothetical protein